MLPSGPFYHGTKADLRPGDLIRPGHRSNYGDAARTSPWVYMTAMRSALGAELARGEGPGRLYIVEPTGPIFDDPDLTDKKFPGNPTRSYRSRHPLRVLGEVTDWVPSPPEMIRAIQEGQTRLYAMQAARIDRGAVYWIVLDDDRGTPGLAHPHVVVQDDVFNHSRIATVVVCALTSNLDRAREPGNVLLDLGEADLPRQSVVVVSQISSVDKTRLGARIGTLSSARVDQIIAGLRFQQASFFAR